MHDGVDGLAPGIDKHPDGQLQLPYDGDLLIDGHGIRFDEGVAVGCNVPVAVALPVQRVRADPRPGVLLVGIYRLCDVPVRPGLFQAPQEVLRLHLQSVVGRLPLVLLLVAKCVVDEADIILRAEQQADVPDDLVDAAGLVPALRALLQLVLIRLHVKPCLVRDDPAVRIPVVGDHAVPGKRLHAVIRRDIAVAFRDLDERPARHLRLVRPSESPPLPLALPLVVPRGIPCAPCRPCAGAETLPVERHADLHPFFIARGRRVYGLQRPH